MRPPRPPFGPLHLEQDAYTGFVENWGIARDTATHTRRRRTYNKENIDYARGVTRPRIPVLDDADFSVEIPQRGRAEDVQGDVVRTPPKQAVVIGAYQRFAKEIRVPRLVRLFEEKKN